MKAYSWRVPAGHFDTSELLISNFALFITMIYRDFFCVNVAGSCSAVCNMVQLKKGRGILCNGVAPIQSFIIMFIMCRAYGCWHYKLMRAIMPSWG